MLVEALLHRQQVIEQVAPDVEVDEIGDVAAVAALPVKGDHRDDRQADQQGNIADHLVRGETPAGRDR